MKKCLYCGGEIHDESIIDFCERCGKSVWGEKMFNTILQNMQTAKEKGDLCHSNNTCEILKENEDFFKR